MQAYENNTLMDEPIIMASESPEPIFKHSNPFYFFMDESRELASEKSGPESQYESTPTKKVVNMQVEEGEKGIDNESLTNMISGMMKRMADRESLLANLGNLIVKNCELNVVRSDAPINSMPEAKAEINPFSKHEGNFFENNPTELGYPYVNTRKGGPPLNYQADAAIPTNSNNILDPATTVCLMPAEWVSRIGIDPIATLASFDVAPNDMFAIERFVSEYEALVAEYQWPEHRCRSILESKIVGEARSIYFSGLGKKHALKLKDRLKELIQIFSIKPSKKEMKSMFEACVLAPGERILRYKIRLEALAEPLRPPPNFSQTEFEESLLDQFMEGLPEDLRLEVIRINPRTFDEAVNFATHMQKPLKIHNDHVNEQVNENKRITHELAQQISSLRAEIDHLNTTEHEQTNNKRNPIRCRYCNKKGHVEHLCYKKIRDTEALDSSNIPAHIVSLESGENLSDCGEVSAQNKSGAPFKRKRKQSFSKRKKSKSTTNQSSNGKISINNQWQIASVNTKRKRDYQSCDPDPKQSLANSLPISQSVEFPSQFLTPNLWQLLNQDDPAAKYNSKLINIAAVNTVDTFENNSYRKYPIPNTFETSVIRHDFRQSHPDNSSPAVNKRKIKGDNHNTARLKNSKKNKTTTIKFINSFHNKPIIRIKIGDRNLTALLDTGAQFSIVNQKDFKYSGNICRKREVVLSSPISKQSLIGYKTVIPCSIGKIQFYQPICVAPLVSNNGYQAILGYDILTQHKAIINNDKKQVKFTFNLEKCWDSMIESVTDQTPIECESILSKPPLEDSTSLYQLFEVDKLDLTQPDINKLKTIIDDNKIILIEDVTKMTGALIDPYEPEFLDDIPIYQRQYRIPHGCYEPLRRQLDKLEKANIIKKTSSNYNSPVLVVPKKDTNEVRIVLDLRKLNKKIVPVRYPLMHIEDILESLGGSKIFSSLDLNNGYFNIKLTEKAQKRFSFSTPWSRFQFCRLSQGCITSSAIFQQIMIECLHEVMKKGHVLVYLDDIIIHSSSIEEHLETLKEVFEALKKINMAIKPSKCKLFRPSLTFLGHTVDNKGCRPLESNINTVLKIPRPTTTRGVRSFLGSVNFYRKFINEFAETAAPLYGLLKRKNVRVDWSDEAEGAFQKLKHCLVTAPLLAFPNFNKPFVIKSDASLISIAAVLEQENDEGDLQPIAYCSRKLNKAEVNYSVIEREALAIVYSVQQFKHLTYGNKIILKTDHKPLSYLFELKESNARIARWVILIQDNDIEIEHIPGKLNNMADMLSRCFENENVQVNAIASVKDPLSCEVIFEAQQEDELCLNIFNEISEGKYVNNEYILDEQQIILKNVRLGDSGWMAYRVLVPDKLREMVMYHYHDNITGGHFSISKTLVKVKRSFTWSTIFSDVLNYVRSCEKCQRRNTVRTKAPLQAVVPPSACMQKLSLDLLGPFGHTPRRNRYMVLWTDHFSRMSFGSPIPNQEAQTIAKDYVENIFTRYGGSSEILSDRGPQLVGHIMSSLCEKLKVNRLLTSSYNPRSNGVSERLNSKVLNLLSHFCNEHYDDWDVLLPFVLQTINNTEHRSSHQVPFFIFHGFYQIDPLTDFNNLNTNSEHDLDDIVEGTMEKLAIARSEVFANLTKSSQLSTVNKGGKRKLREFTIGQAVLYLDVPSYAGQNRKLKPRYKGPYSIIRRIGPVNYHLQDINKPGNIKRAHVDKIKAYYGRPVLDDLADLPLVQSTSESQTNIAVPLTSEKPKYYTLDGKEIDLKADAMEWDRRLKSKPWEDPPLSRNLKEINKNNILCNVDAGENTLTTAPHLDDLSNRLHQHYNLRSCTFAENKNIGLPDLAETKTPSPSVIVPPVQTTHSYFLRSKK